MLLFASCICGKHMQEDEVYMDESCMCVCGGGGLGPRTLTKKDCLGAWRLGIANADSAPVDTPVPPLHPTTQLGKEKWVR